MKHLNRREIAALIASIALLAGTALLLALERLPPASPVQAAKPTAGAADPEPIYTGTIITPDPNTGICRHVQFDNRTGEFRRTDLARCDSSPAFNPALGRLHVIRDSFRK